MKNVYFPNWWDIHNGRLSKNYSRICCGVTEFYASGRALYGDWGRFGNVNLDEELNALPEFNVENPLSYKSDAFYYKKEDGILLDEEDFLETRKQSILAFIRLRNSFEQKATYLKKRHTTDMETFIDAVDSGKSRKVLQNKCKFTPSSLMYLANKKFDLMTENVAANLTILSLPYNSGGRIKIVNFKSTTYVIFSDGINMSKLTVSKLNSIANVLENTEIHQYGISSESETIYQVEAVVYRESIHVLVRFMESVYLLKIYESQDGLNISQAGKYNSMDQFMSCKLGNNYAREFVVTFSDKMELYDSHSNRSIWNKDTVCYSSVIDRWNEIQSTNFPKVWIYTNRYNSNVYDTRINPFSSGLELLNTKMDSFSKSESFYHATNIFQDNYFYLFSALSGFLVDIRSPLVPVSQWTVPSMTPVTYSSIDLLSHIDRINFTLASQFGANHLLFQQHIDLSRKSTALASNPSPKVQPMMSLGVASHFDRHTDEFSILNIDQLGNIIGNQYRLTSDSGNFYKIEPEYQKPYVLKNRLKNMKRDQSQNKNFFESERIAKKAKTSIEPMNRILGIANFKEEKY